jgi:hypothetical protein
MSGIPNSLAFASRAERLTRAASRPDFAIIGPSGGAKRKAPARYSGKEMALSVPLEIVGLDYFDRALVYIAWGDTTGGYQAA